LSRPSPRVSTGRRSNSVLHPYLSSDPKLRKEDPVFKNQFISNTTLRVKFLSKIPHQIRYPTWLTFSNEPSTTKEVSPTLLDDIVEEGVRVLGLDLLLDPPVGGDVRDVGLVDRACAASEESDNATIPSQDNRPRVANTEKLAVRPVRGHDSELDGDLTDTVFKVAAAGEGLQTVDATSGGARGQPIFDDKQALLAVGVEVRRVADLAVLDDAVGLQETIVGVLKGRSIGGVREQQFTKVGNREFTTCGGKKK